MEEKCKVVGYFPCWKPEAAETVDFQVVTHLNYAFAIPTEEGRLLPLRNPGTARLLIQKAHSQGAKALIVVGGWEYEDRLLEPVFEKATGTEEKRQHLAEAILDLCRDFGFDGVDIDWEYPRAGQPSALQYEDLMEKLRKGLDRDGKLLTCAVFSGIDAAGNKLPDVDGQTEKVLKLCDFVNIMAYDGGDGPDHSGYDFALGCARCWLGQGIPKEKLTLGLPFYGRPGWNTYEELCSRVPETPDRDRVTLDGREVWYNGRETIGRKTRWALQNLGGVMIWEITQDSRDPEKSLLGMIQSNI